jgi:hypothetical protein
MSSAGQHRKLKDKKKKKKQKKDRKRPAAAKEDNDQAGPEVDDEDAHILDASVKHGNRWSKLATGAKTLTCWQDSLRSPRLPRKRRKWPCSASTLAWS